MKNNVGLRILLAYILLLFLTLLIWYILGHLLLQMPIWYILIFAGLSIAAVTVGLVIVVRKLPKRK